MNIPFVPWRDDCILPEESMYSVFSKVAWFQALTPAKYWRDCRLPIRRWYPVLALDLSEKQGWTAWLNNEPIMPRVQGCQLRVWMNHLAAQQAQEIPDSWHSRDLRVCDRCLNEGVHLRLHQHMGLSRCHVHGTLLRNHCKHCGKILQLLYGTKTEAFCCSHCTKPLASQPVFGQPRPEAQRQRVEKATEQVRLPLRALRKLGDHIDASRGCDLLWAVSMKCVLLECIHLHIPAHPALRRGRWPNAAITTEALGAGPPTQPSPEVEAAFGRGTSLELQIAACQVAHWFLLTKGEQHAQCLDVPTGMFGASFDPKVKRPEDLLTCCPVAVGFWFWRLSFGHSINVEAADRQDFIESNPNHHTVLILYKALKSHLQYCLYVAMQILANESTRLSSYYLLRGLYELKGTSFRSFRFVPWEFPAMLIRFDIEGDWWNTPCNGNAPYEIRLRRTLHNSPVAAPHDHGVQDSSLSPKAPFVCMRFDRFLFSPEPWSLKPSSGTKTDRFRRAS